MKKICLSVWICLSSWLSAQDDTTVSPNKLANDYKVNCRVATTTDITIATALNAGDTLDGVTLAAGDRVLVKDQLTLTQNGIYVVSASPARATDSDSWVELPGSAVAVTSGTLYAGTAWLNTSAATGTVGSTAVSYLRTVSVDSEGESGLTVFSLGVRESTTGLLGLFSSEHASASYLSPSNAISQDTYYSLPDSTISGATLVTEESIGGFAAHRGARHAAVPFTQFLASSVTGTGVTGTHIAAYHATTYVPAATVGTARIDSGTNAAGSVFGGTGFFGTGTATANFDVKWRFEFSAAVCLPKHADGRVSMHLQHTSSASVSDRAAIEGVSLYWTGGSGSPESTAGKVEIYSHDGSIGGSLSTSYALAVGDQSAHRYALEWEPAVGLRLYRNGVLLITKATNLPTGNSATTNSQGTYIYSVNTANGTTYPSGMYFHNGTVVFLP